MIFPDVGKGIEMKGIFKLISSPKTEAPARVITKFALE